MKNKLPLLRTENLVVKELPNEILIYDLENNKAYCLNETARLIMNECNGVNSVDDSIISLNRKLNTKLDEEMIWMVINQFQEFNLIEKGYEIPVQTTKVSRRRILQTAAALGIALPIVTSLVAPIAAHAQSGCIKQGQPCAGLQDTACCQGAQCVNTEAPPTGFQCIGCIPLGQACTIGGVVCCGGASCASGQTGLVCQFIIG